MFADGARKRVRPGLPSIAFTSFVFAASIALAAGFPFQGVWEPLAVALVIGIVVTWLRLRGIRNGLPEPYGRGTVSFIDIKKAGRSGILVTLGGVFLTIGLMGSVFFLPPEAFFLVVFGVMGGLPFSQILFSVAVVRLERVGGGRIYAVTEEIQEGDNPVLRKSVELVPQA